MGGFEFRRSVALQILDCFPRFVFSACFDRHGSNWCVRAILWLATKLVAMEGYRTHDRLVHVSIDDCLAAEASGDPRHTVPAYRGYYTTLENLHGEEDLSKQWDIVSAKLAAETEDLAPAASVDADGDSKLDGSASTANAAGPAASGGPDANDPSQQTAQTARIPDLKYLGDEDLRVRGVAADEIPSIRAKMAMPVDVEAFTWTQGDTAGQQDAAAVQGGATSQGNRALQHPALHSNLRSVLGQVKAARAQRGMMPQPAQLPDGTWVSALGMPVPADARIPTNERDIFSYFLSEFGDKPDQAKAWTASGVDASDYFNYGLTEKTWKLYCEQQQILRNDVSSMQQMGALQHQRRR